MLVGLVGAFAYRYRIPVAYDYHWYREEWWRRRVLYVQKVGAKAYTVDNWNYHCNEIREGL